MNELQLPFEVWRLRLRDDCLRQDRLLAFNILGDECLRLLWEDGNEPSVRAIIEGEQKIQ